MASSVERVAVRPIHPVHAVLLASAFPLFLGGLLADIAYGRSYEIQWSNFAAWLIAGAMVFTGFALLWALIDLIRARRRRGRTLVYFLALLLLFALGLIDSFVHAQDAWAIMPEATILSAIVVLLSLVALVIGFSGLRSGAAR